MVRAKAIIHAQKPQNSLIFFKDLTRGMKTMKGSKKKIVMLYAYIINWEHIIDFIDGEGCDEMGGV